MNLTHLFVGNIHPVILLLLFVFRCAFADIAVISPDNKSVQLFTDFKISYTSPIPDNGILGYLVRADPSDACSRLVPPPDHNHTRGANYFLLADRATPYHVRCNNRDKIQHATDAGYKAVILYSPYASYYHSLSYFSLDRAGYIPAVYISHEDGEILNKHYLWPKNYKIFITSDLPPNLSYYLLPFAVVIGVCLVLTVSFMVFQLVRCIQERQRVHRHRLPKKFLKKLPLQKYEKGIYYESCAICLDDYVDGEKIRILPCNHAYHTKCIDPWLTKNRRVCPMCKGKIRLPGMPESDDSDSDNDTRQPNFNQSTEISTNERTGLLSSLSSNRARTRPSFGNFFNVLNNNNSGNTSEQRSQRSRRPRNYGSGTPGRQHPIDDNIRNLVISLVSQGPSGESTSAPVVSRLSQAREEARNKRRQRQSHNRQVVVAEIPPTPSQPSINCDLDNEPLIDWNESNPVPSTSQSQQQPRSKRPTNSGAQPATTTPETSVTIEDVPPSTSQEPEESIHRIV